VACFTLRQPLNKQLFTVSNIKRLSCRYVMHPVIPAKAGIHALCDTLQAEDRAPAFAGAAAL